MFMAKQHDDKLAKDWITVVLITIAILLIHLGRRLGWLPGFMVIPEFLCIVATLVFVVKYWVDKRKSYDKYTKSKESKR